MRRGGLGLLAGAVLPFSLCAAQQGVAPPKAPPPPPVAPGDSAKARLDSLKRAADVRDSIAKFELGDTVRAPFAHAEEPRTTEIGEPYRWSREELLASGAMTLADLLERVPGATGFRTAWFVDQQSASYLGDFARVRVFIDGLPFAPPDRDGGRVLDLTAIQLWAFEGCVIERGAAELRIYLRSWRYDKTIPDSRVDVFTGDQDVNLFRGFFAQRFGPGLGIQVAGENLSLSNTRTGGDGSRRAGLIRLGWAAGRWSVDVMHLFADNIRNSQLRQNPFDPIPALHPGTSQSYLRAGWGDPDAGSWLQAMAATTNFAQQSAELNATVRDTNRIFDARSAMYVLQGGTAWGGLRVSGGLRWHSVRGISFTSPHLRASYERTWLALSAYAERSREDSTTHGDVSVRVLPRSWLALTASYGGSGVGNLTGGRVRGYASRAEVGLRVRPDLWLSGGVLARDSAWLKAPVRFDTTLSEGLGKPIQGTFIRLRGRLYSDIFADVTGMSWDLPGTYRPRYQARTEIFLHTRWLSRFKSGAFGLLASVAHEYREPVVFPRDSTATVSGFSRTVNARLEIRILSGTLSWQLRNLVGELQNQVPGALLPRSVSVYGIRWEFRN